MRGIRQILFPVLGFMAAFLPISAWSQAPAGAVITNTAYVSYDGGAGVVYTIPSDTVSITVSPGELLVTKSANRAEVGPGDTVTYDILVQNVGESAMIDVAIQDSLPRMLSYVDSKPSATIDGSIVAWTISRLLPGENVLLQVTCRVERTNYEESIVNSVLFSRDGTAQRRSRPAPVVWRPWAEATLEKTVSPREGYVGDTLTYVLRAVNSGPLSLTQIQIGDTLPEGIDFISSDRDVEVNGRILTWNIPGLAPGAETRLTFLGRITPSASGDSLWNRAALSSQENAGDTAAAAIRFLGQGVGIEIIKEAADSVFAAGDTLTYDLILTNSGVRKSRSIVIRDTLSPHLEYVGASHDGIHENQIVTWNLSDIPAGYHDTLRVEAAIRVPIPNQTRVNNEAWAYSAEGSQDSSHWEIRVISRADAELKKRVDRAQCFIGDTLTYTLEARNTGSTTLTAVQVSDTLPAEVSFIDASPSVTANDGVLTWEIGNLGYRETARLEYRAIVLSEATTDSIRNNASLTCHEGVHRTAAASVRHWGQGAGIEIIKEAADSLFNAGDTLTYDLIVQGSLGHSDYHITVRDTLPQYLEYIGSTHDGFHQNQIVSWNLDAPETGYHDTLRVTAAIRIPIEDQTVVTNVAWAYSSEGAQDSSRWRITVTSLPNLLLEIQGPAVASPGDTIRYSLTCANIGTATAFNPVLRDTLPEILTFVEASGPVIHDPDTSVVQWQLSPLAPGDRDTLSLDARIHEQASADAFVNSAWLSYLCATRTALATANCATETPPQEHSLFSYKIVDRKIASEGDTLTYQIHFGCLKRGIQDTVHIMDYLPNQVQPIEDLAKTSAEMVSYDPVAHRIHFILYGLSMNQRDSVAIPTVVRQALEPGVQEIENQAIVWIRQDTARTADDARSQTKTRLVAPFLSVKKTVNRKVTEVGDVLTYTVSCENKSLTTPLYAIQLRDLLPEGFRYQEGASILDSTKIGDPEFGNTGKRILLRWTLPDTLGPGKTLRVKYRATVGLGTRRGEHENLASASALAPDGIEVHSDEASASVLVKQGAFDDRGLIFGKVYEDLNKNGLHDDAEPQLKNIELILEDGTRVKTDAFGKYSIPDVEHGQHVLRLNEKTLPKGKRVIFKDFEFMDDSKSRLIQVPPGGMGKANFPIETIE